MTKIISGHPIYRECWKYTSQYECIAPNSVDTCSQLQPHGCWQTNSTCAVVAFNGECIQHKQTYRCPNKFNPALPGTTYIRPVYTITKDTIIDGCSAHESNPYCVLASETCLEPGGVRNINGLDVYKDCWKWSRSYTCSSDTMTSDCDKYAKNPNCQLIRTQCIMHSDDGKCAHYTRDYRCITGYTESKTVVECGDKMFCLDGASGGCFNVSYEHDKDFAHAVTMLEISRQAGIYSDPETLTVFNGQSSFCKRSRLSNCCKVNPRGSGMSNQNIGTSLAYQAVGAMLVEGVEYIGYATGNLIGSFYTYDKLFMSDAPNWLVNGVERIFGQFGVSNTYTFNPSISVFGFTGTFGAVPQTTLGVANIKMGSVPVFGGAQLNFYFNPAMFAISVAAMVISQLTQCDEQEKVLALRRGAGLCHEVGEWCSRRLRILRTCLQRKRSYCCYNSKLARIIQQQAKPRLGIGWGSPQSPNCSGLTPEQLASLDFSTMDFSEFYADVRARQIDMAAASSHVSGHAQSIVNRMGERYRNYFDN